MKKEFVFAFLFCLTAQVASAFNISTSIVTTGDVNAWTSINTTGNVGIYIDGANWTDIPSYIQENEGKWSRDRGISASNLASIIEDACKLIIGINREPNSWHVRIAKALLSVFATKTEVEKLRQENRLLLFRVEALESTIEKIAEREYCQGKLEVMLKYNLTSVRCKSVTYYNPAFTSMKSIVGIEPVE